MRAITRVLPTFSHNMQLILNGEIRLIPQKAFRLKCTGSPLNRPKSSPANSCACSPCVSCKRRRLFVCLYVLFVHVDGTPTGESRAQKDNYQVYNRNDSISAVEQRRRTPFVYRCPVDNMVAD